jgi:hypothetical protein
MIAYIQTAHRVECKLSCMLIKYILEYHIKHVVSHVSYHVYCLNVSYHVLNIFNKYTW